MADTVVNMWGGEPVPPFVAEMTLNLVLEIAEMPDRTSPEDFPDALLVTSAELTALVSDFVCETFAPWRDLVLSLEWANRSDNNKHLDQCVSCWRQRRLGHTPTCELAKVLNTWRPAAAAKKG